MMNLAVEHYLRKRQTVTGRPALSVVGWLVVGILALLSCAAGRVGAHREKRLSL